MRARAALDRGARLTLLCCLLLAGCARDGGDYFPLGESMWWQYRVERTIKGEPHEQKLILANLPAANIDAHAVYPRRRMDDRFEYYAEDDKGIYWLSPTDGARIQILGRPLVLNAKWQGSTRIFFLDMTGGFAPTFEERARESMSLDYVVESFDDTVHVGAGRFQHCIRVKSSGSNFAGLKLKQLFGIRFLKVEQTEWYAPGVGLVKRVRNEYTTPADFSNEYVQELERYKRS